MERNVLELLEKSVDLYKNKIAVKDAVSAHSFSELCNNSKKIGSALLSQGVKGKTIPVFMEKSVLALETFFGIVYAGGSYSMINMAQPRERVERILHILNAPCIITDKNCGEIVQKLGFVGEILLAEELLQTEVAEDKLQLVRETSIDIDVLYVNFTSGSTGVPKGVAVGHKSVIEFIHYFVSIFHITSEDIIGNQAPFDFDVSVKDIYSMLMTGATMYIIPKEEFSFPHKLLDTLERENITTLIWAVSALCIITTLRGFTYKVPAKVNKVLFSGEVMPVQHLQEWKKVLPEAMFVNLYGPTEITCNCTYYIVKNQDETKLPIGKAFPNERVFLLDGDNREVMIPGTEGEVCVTGSTLALGYFGDTEKTQQAFVQNPLQTNYAELMYRTGDLAYYREDGNLVYVGRKDCQIKHMGHRIELGEIEACMNMVQGIERVCCLYDEQKKQIIAVYQGTADKAAIKSELRHKLMKYMIPEKFLAVESIPMTVNGKIDRKKLKAEFIKEQS